MMRYFSKTIETFVIVLGVKNQTLKNSPLSSIVDTIIQLDEKYGNRKVIEVIENDKYVMGYQRVEVEDNKIIVGVGNNVYM